MRGHLSPEVLELVARRFRVLAEPARLRILNELMLGERTVVHASSARRRGQK